MTSLQLLRDKRRDQRLEHLHPGCAAVLRAPGEEIWLYGSWARGDGDSRSDVDLLVAAEDRAGAETLGERLLGLCLADDVICLSQAEWQDRRQGRDPHWRGIVRDAVLLSSGYHSSPVVR